MVEIALIGKAFIIAMTVLSIWYTMQEGEIFGFVTKYGDKYIPEYLQPPLYSCNVCMTSGGVVLYTGYSGGSIGRSG